MTKKEHDLLSKAMRLLLDWDTFDEGRRIIECDLLGRKDPFTGFIAKPYHEICREPLAVEEVMKERENG